MKLNFVFLILFFANFLAAQNADSLLLENTPPTTTPIWRSSVTSDFKFRTSPAILIAKIEMHTSVYRYTMMAPSGVALSIDDTGGIFLDNVKIGHDPKLTEWAKSFFVWLSCGDFSRCNDMGLLPKP